MKLVSIAALLLGAVPVAVNAAAVGGTPNGAKIIPVSDAAGLRSVGAHSSKYPNRKTVTIRPSKNDYDDISSDFLWGIKQANHGGRLLLEKGKKYVIGKKLDLTFLDNIEVQLEGELKVCYPMLGGNPGEAR